jgi:hypothetical protein
MCLYYSLLAIFWMIVSSIYWRQLLRIQFWVGAVILLGMMEKAMFYFEYHQANSIGYSSMPLALSAELVSDDLFIIMSLFNAQPTTHRFPA